MNTDLSDSAPSSGIDFLELSTLLLYGKFHYKHLQEGNLLAQFFAKLCPNPRLAIVGISELLINAIEHGNLGIKSDEKAELQRRNVWLDEIERRLSLPEYKDKLVEVEYSRSKSEIQIKVTDQGDGFDWQAYENQAVNPANRLASHGRGILMAKQLVFKKLEYSGRGNVVTGVIALE